MKIKNKFILLTILILLSVVPAAYAQNFQQIGATDCGVLYIDLDSVKAVKRDGVYYLAVMGEEKYTDANFLKALRTGENMQDAASALQLYLFNNVGNAYSIAASYVLDGRGKVCADLGADMTVYEIKPQDKTLKKAYTAALKTVENKKKFSVRK